MSSPPQPQSSPLTRKQAALKSIARRKSSLAPERPPVDLAYLVRLYLLDGSSKVLQMKESSTTADVLEQLKYNMDLISIKTFAIYRLSKPSHSLRRLELHENIQSIMTLQENENEVKLLFRSWICDENGKFEKSALQDGVREKQPNTALWLKYIEAIFMISSGKYLLTDDEAIMLGCLKLQADSGDYRQAVHTIPMLQTRISNSFPAPIKEKMKNYLMHAEKNKNKKSTTKGEEVIIAERVKMLYSRLAGYTKTEAQIEFIRYLRVWCPFYNSTFFSIDCQYDDRPYDPTNQPPVLKVQIAISPLAVFIITRSTPPVIFRLSYKRIVKYVAHDDMNIFMFWILKDSVNFSDILQKLDGDNISSITEGDSPDDVDEELGYNPNQYCDCIYFVTEEVKEITFLFETNFKMCKYNTPPLLPGDTPEEEGEEIDDEGQGKKGLNRLESFESEMKRKEEEDRKTPQKEDTLKRPGVEKRSSRLNLFFQALVGGDDHPDQTAVPQSLIEESDIDQPTYNDDAVQASNNMFTEVYKSSGASAPPPPPPPRRSSTAPPDADDQLDQDYQGIDMLLANSLSELNDITKFETKQALSPPTPPGTAPPPPPGEHPAEGRRKSLFAWGTK